MGPETKRRALQGFVLALGAPAGWLCLRVIDGHQILGELQQHTGLYLYLLAPTAIVFAGFGALLGIREERLAAANAQLSADALTDALTGVRNLRYFNVRLDEEQAVCERDGTDLSLLMVDLDHFKLVNDRYGHPEGDRLLRAVGLAISSVIRAGETAARVGGEEFALLLPGADGREALAAAERVRASVAAVQLHPSHGGTIHVTVSVGCASSADLGTWDAASLYWAADEAMYAAKAQGRDQAVRAGMTGVTALSSVGVSSGYRGA